MSVSIIIVNYNTLELTQKCIDSVYKSVDIEDLEIILVDNGSTDGSREFFTDKQNEYPSFRYIYNSDNLGFSKANNIGIKNSSGEYKLLLNSDTLVEKDAISKMLDFAVSRDNVGVVGPRLLNTDGTIQASCFNFPSIRLAIKQHWFKSSPVLDKYYPRSEKPTTVDIVVAAAFLITPEALKKVGLLNEKYFFFYEDFDYCREISKKGLKTFYFPEAQVIHHHGKSGEKLQNEDSWKRLIPGSKIYHGTFRHYVLNFVIWTGQKFSKS